MRAAACFAFSSAVVGAWLLGVWAFGSSLVYADVDDPASLAPPISAEAASAGRAAASGTAASGTATSGTPAAGSADARGADPAQPLANGTEPLAPRVPQSYALDERWRVVGHGQLTCPEVALTEFSGEAIAFVPQAHVALPFRQRMAELERVVQEVSLEFYGRVPTAILVASSYDCRSVSGKNQRLSEHALGNAIDISGFRFGSPDPEAAFEVRVDRHWKASGSDARHARFLRALTQALIARDVFRTLLGPAHPDHADHFHFDMAPHYYVDL